MPNHQWLQRQSGKIQGRGLQCMEFVFKGVQNFSITLSNHNVTESFHVTIFDP